MRDLCSVLKQFGRLLYVSLLLDLTFWFSNNRDRVSTAAETFERVRQRFKNLVVGLWPLRLEKLE